MQCPEDYRRQADLTDEAARCISLITDKESLFAQARALRQRADTMEAERDQGALRQRHVEASLSPF